jgi:hypothetical protein
MKDNVFRSIGFWKSAIMTLPDNSCLELLRSVFGKIRTPFNKQILLDDLESFLLREDIQRNIACYFDHNDARIIAAVAVLGEPIPGELESFFSGEFSYAELQDLIVNLEERFIFYRFREKGLSRLALNPVLKPILTPFIADTSLLFPSVKAADDIPDMESAIPSLNDRILAGLLAFVSEREPFFRNEGEIRKRIIDEGNKVFPGIELRSVVGGLRALGLFRSEGDRLFPDYRCFSDFGKLSPRERMEYCAAGICCFRNSNSSGAISPYLFHAQVRYLAGFIHRFLNSLETKYLYPDRTLRRLADILKHDSADNTHAVPVEEEINGLIETLEMTGLLFPVSAGYRRLSPLVAAQADQSAPDIAETGETNAVQSPVIAMDTAFSCLVYPEISYIDAISLAAILAVREAGVPVRFELTRDSAIRAFDRSLSADSMIELLKRLSANRIDDNLIWTLKDWEKRYGEVSLRRGLLLSLSEERRYLAETESLSRFIKETLAPGIYLLSETAEDKAVEALHKAGVDIIDCRGENTGGTETPSGLFLPPAFIDSQIYEENPRARRQPLPPPKEEPASTPTPSASTLIAGFHSILEQMQRETPALSGPGLSKAERDELAARIDRRLVLCESQLRDASVRYEKLEARLLDYVGKAAIAKQAIAQRSPLELIRSGKDGERLFGVPKALEKEDGESILVISPLGKESGDTLRIPLGKISLLRRIKKSIFENNS